jgi:cis-3-alkyl-4-acyloxetan-2-one decarboxylase
MAPPDRRWREEIAMLGSDFERFAFTHPHGFTQRGWDTGPRDAPCLVFVHGNPSSKFLFRHLILAARAQYRCIALDHIGMGDSDKPDRGAYDFHFETRAQDLARCLEHLQPRRPLTLIVHDWGGIIGLRYAQTHPGVLRRLVITNTATFPLLPGKKLPFAIGFIRNSWIGGVVCKYLNGFQRGAVWIGVGKKMLKDDARAYLDAHANPHDCEAILRFVRDIPLSATDRGYDKLLALQEFLPTLRALPIQIHWGMRDFVFDADYLAAFERLYPEAECHRYPDAGHWLMEDAHADMQPRFMRFLQDTEKSA